MYPKFIPVSDMKSEKTPGAKSGRTGLKSHHQTWSDLFKDPTAGDSLANAGRHWNGVCYVNPPFLIIGDSTTASVLDHYAATHLVNPLDDTGVVMEVIRSKGRFQPSYTVVLVQPGSFSHDRESPVVTVIGDIAARLRNFDKSRVPGFTLSEFRPHLSFYNKAARYLDV